ncbi:MAG TPA: hypothetical protein VGP46_10795, partial [Acidimicrobiales bacterium]|nr:hypothetical protein [Acidimicrobiales bacterium]
MQALLWGVRGEAWDPPDPDNHRMVGLSKVPMRLVDQEPPGLLGDDWVIARTRLTGICGSEAKQIFGDFTGTYPDSAMAG